MIKKAKNHGGVGGLAGGLDLVLYDDTKSKKRIVKQHVNTSHAHHERKNLQQRDTLFRNSRGFCVPKKKRHKLQIGGAAITSIRR
jgi:hypothetical protein